jgi:hypothetical protein
MAEVLAVADTGNSPHGKQKKRGAAQFSIFHITQMVISTTLLIGSAIVMLFGGYLMGGAMMVMGTVLGLVNFEGE